MTCCAAVLVGLTVAALALLLLDPHGWWAKRMWLRQQARLDAAHLNAAVEHRRRHLEAIRAQTQARTPADLNAFYDALSQPSPTSPERPPQAPETPAQPGEAPNL